MAADLLADQIRSIETAGRVVPEARVLALRDALFALVLQDLGAAASHQTALLALCDSPNVDAAGAVLLHRALGEMFVFLGRTKDADTHFRVAVERAREIDRPDLFGRAVVGWVHVLGLLGREPEARRWAASGRKALTALDDVEYLAKLAINEGNLAYHEGAFRVAAKLYRTAAAHFARSGADAYTSLQVKVNEAIALTQLGSFDAARRVFGEVEDEAERHELHYIVAHARFNRAELERILGRYREALADLESASEIFEKAEAIDLRASAERTRSELLLELGLPEDAAIIAAGSARAFQAEGMKQDAGISHVIAARASRLAGDVALLEASLRSGRECLDGHPLELAELRLENVLLDLEVGAFDAARDELEQLERSEHSGTLFAERLTLARIRLEMDTGRLDTAEARAQRRMRSRRPLRLTHRMDLYRLAGGIALRSGNPGRASRRWTRASVDLEAYRRLLPNATLRGAGFGQKLDVYLDLMRLELERTRPRVDRLLSWSEAARARLLKDRLRKDGQRDLDRFAAERWQLSQLLVRLETERGDPRVSRELEVEITRKEAALAAKLRTVADADSTPQARPESQEFTSFIGEDEVCVSYFCLPPRVVAFVLSRQTLDCIPLETPLAEIDDSIDRFRFQLDNAAAGGWYRGADTLPGRSLDRSLHQLYEALLAPLEQYLRGAKRLLVVPHRRLHQVPFECFFAVHEPLRQLVVSRVPALQVLGNRGRTRRNIDSVTVLGLNHPDLRSIPIEVDRVAASGGGGRCHATADLTRDAVLGSLEASGALHIATHARFREQNPAFSHFLCNDGAVFVDDLDRVRARSGFVFLSACETGRVAGVRGDELVSVAHSFLSAGVNRLVATRWAVDDEATLEFVGRFYEHLWSERSPDPAVALHDAMISSSDSGRHLFEWGGFSAFDA